MDKQSVAALLRQISAQSVPAHGEAAASAETIERARQSDSGIGPLGSKNEPKNRVGIIFFDPWY